ncbi:MAG: hypothetical protein ACI4TF_03055 [Oliverpabstia sp.]
MKKNNKGRGFIFTPFLMALGSAYFKSIWLVPATIILMFILVAVLPFCHKRENLWLFVLCAVCAIPINIFLLTEYPQWRYLLYSDSERGITYYMALIEMLLIATGVEEVLVSLVGRKIWKRQYTLYIPENKDEQ